MQHSHVANEKRLLNKPVNTMCGLREMEYQVQTLEKCRFYI
jgi:hypothetical protein